MRKLLYISFKLFDWLIKSEYLQYEKDIIEQYMGGSDE